MHVQQQHYRMNPDYVVKVKEEIDKLLPIGFNRPIKKATWLNPIVVVPKNNGKIRVCVDYRKLNVATMKNAFPLGESMRVETISYVLDIAN